MRKYLSTFYFFYGYLKHKIFVLIALSTFVALFDSIGLTMFIPLLGKATSGFDYANQLGDMKILMDILRNLGFNFSLGGVLLVIAILFTAKGIFRYLEDYYRVRLRLIFMKSIRYELIDNLAQMEFSNFTKSNTGEIQNNMTVEVNQVILAFEHYFRAAQGIATTLIYLTLAFIASPQFALLVLCAGLISNLFYQRIYRYTKNLSHEVTKKGHVFHSLLLQNVNHFKYLKATSTIKKYTGKLKDKINDIVHAQLQIGRYNALLFGSRETVATIVVILVIFIKVRLLGGLITAMLLSLMFFYRALGAILMVQNNWNLYLGNSGSVESLKKFIADLKEQKEKVMDHSISGELEKIELRNLNFSYRKDEVVLKEINLDIYSGETVAIVGKSGSGKTTLMNLISGLLDNYSGSVMINGEELKNANKKNWQSRLGYITQEPVIFDDTVANNITFWDDLTIPENKERFDFAVKSAAIESFIHGLEYKEQTELGYNGIQISGGQKQRISIARELYRKDVQLLILDEATSSLDSENERLIQQSVERLRGTCTVLIIAHRLPTIKNADRIILMHKGSVEMVGKFSELQISSERFKDMVELQEF